MLHHWEEPPISGNFDGFEKKPDECGSGAIFFTHCSLGCVYCQNSRISRKTSVGVVYSAEKLAEEMLKLEKSGAYNINLVSPTHYAEKLIETVRIAKKNGLRLPIVWNTGGYETLSTIKMLEDTVDIFLTDFKYASPELAKRLSLAEDYPSIAEKALAEMYSLVGEVRLDSSGIMTKGVIVRHLALPSHRDDSIACLEKIAQTVPKEKILLSLMAQYTPEFLLQSEENREKYPDIARRITTYEYGNICEAARKLGFVGFMQDRSSATKKFTPDF